MKAIEALESKALHVHPLQCSRLRHQLSTCQRCSTYCPTGAISWEESLDINVDKCTGCGICATVCPNSVFEANNPNNNTLLHRVASGLHNSKQITFACNKLQQATNSEHNPDNMMTVPCLGRIDESILVSCIALGSSSVLLASTLCPDCEYKAGWAVAQQTTAIANAILGTFGIQQVLQCTPNMPKWATDKDETGTSYAANTNNKSYSRRDFFKAIIRETKRATLLAASSSISPSQSDEKVEIRKSGLPFYFPPKRSLLIETMKRLGKPHRSTIKIENSPFCQLTINSNCTGCGMCAYFCPTGALKKIEKEGAIAITFQPAHCTNCDLCREICYRNAIAALPEVNPEKLLRNPEDTLFVTVVNNESPKGMRQ